MKNDGGMKPFRIGLIMKGGPRWMGGIEYIKNLINALVSQPPEIRSTFEIYLFCSQLIDANLYKQIQPHVARFVYIEKELKPFSIANRIRWKIKRSFMNNVDPRFEDAIVENDIDFIYPYFNRSDPDGKYKSASWITDFQHKYLTEFFDKVEINRRDDLFENNAKYSPIVVLSSKTAEEDFKRFYPYASHKTAVLNFSTFPVPQWYEGNPDKTRQEYNLPERFFIISNQFWQHKDHLSVFKALKILKEKDVSPNIVCTGHIYDSREPGYSDEILHTIHKYGIANQVYLLGLIPREDQIQLMRKSIAVIQPSLFEGWSTVVEDARCLGKPIILSDLKVNIEQNPPFCAYFKRNDPEDLAVITGEWWDQYKSGPDYEKEETAKLESLQLIKMFGKRFLEIAKSV